MAKDHDAKLREEAIKAAKDVITSWFYDEKFRKSYVPEPKYFLHQDHAIIAEMMRSRGAEWGGGQMYLAELAKHPQLKKNSGYKGLEALIHGTPTVVDPWYAVTRLRESIHAIALRRGYAAALSDPVGGGVLSELQKRGSEALIASVIESEKTSFSIRDVIEASYDNQTRAKEGIVVSSGYESVDDATGQIRRKMNWLIGAETNWGKSTFAVFLVWLSLIAGRRPLVVSSEDPPELYGDRMIALIGKINATDYRDGNLSKEDLERVHNVRAKYQHYINPFFIKANGRPVEQVAGEIASYCASEKIDIVLVDWLQSFVTLKDFGPNRRMQVTHIGKTLFDVVRNAGAAGVFFSQLTVESGKTPTKNWIRDSKDLINMSDVVGIGTINRDAKPVERALKIEKVKNGWATGSVNLNFNERSACFEPDEKTMRDINAQLTANEMGDFLTSGPNEVKDFDEFDSYQP